MMEPEELLRMCREERRRSIGFGQGEADGGELVAVRERALEYARGRMDDIPSLSNRSAVVSTDVADAVETVLPDIIEVFFGGDDVAAFDPLDENDEAKAQQESDYISSVIFNDNPGFVNFYTAFKDALMLRTGLLHWWVEEEETYQTIEGDPMDVLMRAGEAGLDPEADDIEVEHKEDGSICLKVPTYRQKLRIKAWPAEDFTVALDTVTLSDTTYCCARSRMRVQDLIANGTDPEKARSMPPYTPIEAVHEARDYSGEHEWNNATGDGLGDLRTVEVFEHYIRLLDGDDLKIYRVITDREETVLLDSDEVTRIPFAAFSPFLVAHRFYGESLAEKLFEVQKIKTVLWRMLLDSGYFSLNQRVEVVESGVGDHTIDDLIRNEPGVPIRVKAPGTVTPLTAGGLNFDAPSVIEMASVMGEQRSGVVRNAQGLNPDTLHDTAKGAMALMATAQRRVRMIARVIAETGFKDLFIGVRETIREGFASKAEKRMEPLKARLKGQWVEVDPSTWPDRSGMTVNVGIGSAGREHDLMVANQGLQITQEIIQLQGGSSGPLVDVTNIHNWLKKWSQAAGIKTPELYWSDPANAQPQPEKPDPEAEKLQAQLQLEQAKAQAKAEADRAKAQMDYDLAMAKLKADMELKRYQTDRELELKRDTLAAELAMKERLGMLQAQVGHDVGMARAGSVSDVNVGGDPG